MANDRLDQTDFSILLNVTKTLEQMLGRVAYMPTDPLASQVSINLQDALVSLYAATRAVGQREIDSMPKEATSGK